MYTAQSNCWALNMNLNFISEDGCVPTSDLSPEKLMHFPNELNSD